MNNNDFIVGLDIGTTKICALVGRKNEHGKIEIVGMGKADSLGVMRGVVANIDKTVEAIKQAVRDAEDQSGVEIKNVYVGIAGQHIKSLQHRGIIVRENTENEIGREDIKRLAEDMKRLVVAPGDRIIQVIPQEYIVDNEQGIKDPVGMAGVRLEANFHIITGQISAAQNIKKCVEKAGLHMVDMFLEPLASSVAVLSEDEKEAGVALVDIGGGTTDIAIFQDGIIRHTYVIPFGGNSITDDIKEGCLVMRNQAEILKVRFGSALAQETQDNQIVSIPGLRGREPKEISVRNLASIIQARMEEIVEHVDAEIAISGYKNKMIAGIVITGGGAHLKHLVQLTQFKTGLDARIGLPIEHLAPVKLEHVKHPMYSTGVGLIMQGFEDYEAKRTAEKVRQAPVIEEGTFTEPKEEEKPKKNKLNIFSSLFQTTKDWFNEGVDDEFKTK